VAVGNGGDGDFTEGIDHNGFPNDRDYGNCLVRLSTTNNNLAVADYFAMSNVVNEIANDWDLASGSPLLLPPMADGQGKMRQLVAVAGKDENMYIADSANLGKYNPENNFALYEELPRIFSGTNNTPPDAHGQSGGMWAMPAYFNGTLYFGPVRGPITAFPFQNARLTTSSSHSPTVYGYPGSQLSISANGTSNGIVWAVETVGKGGFEGLPTKAAILHAYDATNLAHELYNSNQATNTRDQFGNVTDFVTPMVNNGQVYVASSQGVAVFGLMEPSGSAARPLQQWRRVWFGSTNNTGPGANGASPAGDGVPNLIKYALGIPPFTSASLSQLITVSLTQNGCSNFLTLSVNRDANPTDVTVQLQFSTDLMNWSPNPTNTTILVNTINQLELMDNTPVGNGGAAFVRMSFVPASNF
jgi:hypothetical protein